jgi:putative tryptophan/tyrosine transport system substrate-binding protein
LNQAGFIERRNVVIEYRWAEGHHDRSPTLGSGAGSEPSRGDLCVGRPANRPGGNITGVNFLAAEIVAKRFEPLRELVPKATMTALLVKPGSPTSETEQQAVEAAARGVGQTVLVLNVSTPATSKTPSQHSSRDEQTAYLSLRMR